MTRALNPIVQPSNEIITRTILLNLACEATGMGIRVGSIPRNLSSAATLLKQMLNKVDPDISCRVSLERRTRTMWRWPRVSGLRATMFPWNIFLNRQCLGSWSPGSVAPWHSEKTFLEGGVASFHGVGLWISEEVSGILLSPTTTRTGTMSSIRAGLVPPSKVCEAIGEVRKLILLSCNPDKEKKREEEHPIKKLEIVPEEEPHPLLEESFGEELRIGDGGEEEL